MSSASGQYRLEPQAAAFFGTSVLRLVAHDDTVLGRFGRLGFVRGKLKGHILDARWSERVRYGWITIRFDARYTMAECRYGLDEDAAAIGSAGLSKIKRRSRRKQAS